MMMLENLKENLLLADYKGAFTTLSGAIDNTNSFWLNRYDCNELFV